MVIVSHSINLGGFGSGDIVFGRTGLGGIAVDGFFGISGYLIAGSALTHGFFRYLWIRALRIMPAYWACLVVVAFGFGIVGWLHSHSGLHDYLSAPLGPFRYVAVNSLLHRRQVQISGTPAHVPYPLVWDGSLWTLEWEFLCYIGIGVLAVIGLLQRRRVVLAITIVACLIELAVNTHSTLGTQALRLIPIFLVGAVLRLYGDRVPDRTLDLSRVKAAL